MYKLRLGRMWKKAGLIDNHKVAESETDAHIVERSRVLLRALQVATNEMWETSRHREREKFDIQL